MCCSSNWATASGATVRLCAWPAQVRKASGAAQQFVSRSWPPCLAQLGSGAASWRASRQLFACRQ